MPVCKREHVCQVGLVKCFLPKQAEREHALSSMPGERPFCKIAERERALSSMPGEMPFCKNKLLSSMPGEMPFCETSSKRTCLEPQKGLS